MDRLKAQGITHVVNLRHGHHNKQVRQFNSLWLPFPDDKKPRPRWFYRQALGFYWKAMRKPKAKVFVMCHHGICRSASLAYFLLRADGFSHLRAQNAVFRVRPRAIIARGYRESGEIYLAFERAEGKLPRR